MKKILCFVQVWELFDHKALPIASKPSLQGRCVTVADFFLVCLRFKIIKWLYGQTLGALWNYSIVILTCHG